MKRRAAGAGVAEAVRMGGTVGVGGAKSAPVRGRSGWRTRLQFPFALNPRSVNPFTMPLDPKSASSLSKRRRRGPACRLRRCSYALRHHPKDSGRDLAATRRGGCPQLEATDRTRASRVSTGAYPRGAVASAPGADCICLGALRPGEQARENPFLKNVFAGAGERATQMGFASEEFWTNDPGITDQRLEQILRRTRYRGRTRPSPVTTAETAITLGGSCAILPAAVIGTATWTPELDHAGHHRFLGTMRMALAELGKARPAPGRPR